MNRVYLTAAALVFLTGASVRADDKKADDKPASPSFTKDVKPFLTTYCVQCHNDKTAKSGYNLDGYANLMKGSRKGPAVVAEKPDKSRLYLALTGKAKQMPPKKYAKQPKAEEIDLIKAWIAAGAKDDTDKGAQSGAAPAVRPTSALARTILGLYLTGRGEELPQDAYHSPHSDH